MNHSLTGKEVLKPEEIECDRCLAFGKRLIKFQNIHSLRHYGIKENLEKVLLILIL